MIHVNLVYHGSMDSQIKPQVMTLYMFLKWFVLFCCSTVAYKLMVIIITHQHITTTTTTIPIKPNLHCQILHSPLCEASVNREARDTARPLITPISAVFKRAQHRISAPSSSLSAV